MHPVERIRANDRGQQRGRVSGAPVLEEVTSAIKDVSLHARGIGAHPGDMRPPPGAAGLFLPVTRTPSPPK
jgi:hypothetical protein